MPDMRGRPHPRAARRGGAPAEGRVGRESEAALLAAAAKIRSLLRPLQPRGERRGGRLGGSPVGLFRAGRSPGGEGLLGGVAIRSAFGRLAGRRLASEPRTDSTAAATVSAVDA